MDEERHTRNLDNSGSPSVSAGILTLNTGAGIKTNTTFQYQAVGFRANYGLGTGREWVGFIDGQNGPRTMIGDLTTDVDDLYLEELCVGRKQYPAASRGRHRLAWGFPCL